MDSSVEGYIAVGSAQTMRRLAGPDDDNDDSGVAQSFDHARFRGGMKTGKRLWTAGGFDVWGCSMPATVC
jgi:hypothetical protein